jgi:hypothetical protein
MTVCTLETKDYLRFDLADDGPLSDDMLGSKVVGR